MAHKHRETEQVAVKVIVMFSLPLCVCVLFVLFLLALFFFREYLMLDPKWAGGEGKERNWMRGKGIIQRGKRERSWDREK